MNRIATLVLTMLALSAVEAGAALAQVTDRAASRVEGRILDGSGDPLTGVTVEIAPDAEGALQTAQTDARGRFAFDVTPGAYRLALNGEGPPGRFASPRFAVESRRFTVDADADLTMALPFQTVIARVEDQHGRGLAGFTMNPTLTDQAAPFITAGIDWVGRSTYDDAASLPVTDAAGEVRLFLFPTAYDLTALPPDDLGLDSETHPAVSVFGTVTQTFVFDLPERANAPPLAEAGADRSVRVGRTVSLDGAGSSDRDGDLLSYHWRLVLPQPVTGTAEIVDGRVALPQPVTGTAEIVDWGVALPQPVSGVAALIDAETARPSFVARAPGVYTVELVVNDGATDSAPTRVVLTVRGGKEQTLVARFGRFERSAHGWMKTQRWPHYMGLGAMAVGQVIYVRAQYANNNTLIHPAQSLFDFGFNLSAYVMTNSFTDYAGVSLLQNWMLQAVINTTFDYPIVWPEEPSHYDLFGVDVPKFFYGDVRWVQLGVGVGLIVVPRIIRKLRRRG